MRIRFLYKIEWKSKELCFFPNQSDRLKKDESGLAFTKPAFCLSPLQYDHCKKYNYNDANTDCDD